MNAFPRENMASQHRSGMGLRDYFAAKVVTWFLTELMAEDLLDDPTLTRQFAADHAYKMADAMMKAREA
jgi:hypothetical protein